MADRPRTARSLAASAVGWIIVGIIAFWLVRAAFGTVFWFLRSIIWIVVLAALVWAYFRLRSSDDDA
ncbi:MAG TPA: hypothetical protein VG478_08535 [Acidimicrobiales bacterium]|jgi:hypothetical protein|nr:hypothetical protein [Acidimicrobiales bacterium]